MGLLEASQPTVVGDAVPQGRELETAPGACLPVDPLRDAQAFFGERVEAYRRSRSHADAADLQRMVDLLNPRPGERAIDIATGGGHTARALRAAGCVVIATDATRPMLAAMRDECDARAVADAQALPFGDATVDIVASRIAPHHFPDLDAFVADAARALRPGGRLYAFDLTSPEDVGAARIVDRIERLRDPSHVWSHAPSAWRRSVERAGLTLERLERGASEFDLEPWLARADMGAAREDEARALLAKHPAATLGGYGIVAPGRMRVLRVEVLARRPAAH